MTEEQTPWWAISFANRDTTTAGLVQCCAKIMAEAPGIYCAVADETNRWVITIGRRDAVTVEYLFATGTEAVCFLSGIRAALAMTGQLTRPER